MSAAEDKDLGKILVTGATGQVGRRLVAALIEQGQAVSVLTRSREAATDLWPQGRVEILEADLTAPSTLGLADLDQIDTLFHLASYSPGAQEPDIYNAPSHWEVTAKGTQNLTARLRQSRVRRIVYLSSIKAMGDQACSLGRPADESTAPQPDTLYGRAKLKAEQAVLELEGINAIKTSVMRLPMVYGIGDAGNIPRMIAAIAAGRFPPWPRIENHRSAVHVDDVIAAAILIARSPKTAGQVYCVTDGGGYSTRWIYEQILCALGKKIPGWTVPLSLLRLAAGAGSAAERLLGRRMPLTSEGLSKLTGDAWLSSDKLRLELGFTPRHSLRGEIPRLTQALRARPSPGPERPRDP
ncbi:NAD-dependent epimerase/dehydratase family protein [Thiorhodococcus mannitoliphagus]|uniref:NAD-dependent epimerase/dehydratase family protein n=1 Tax=Thiorhodococcus mannitoliphagus TaxID=329406 RepID=A0A6P1DTJ3_9GAMM|nr:NAD-dependent epimerase/dehydratase family protein [Thiorhodococcus mannitoliphagus]NEX19352.1 NAD-dependent epimerase/dehydratase family protein [Thiorhodococcus mannitoliphagus]